MELNVVGGTKYQRKVAESVVKEAARMLMHTNLIKHLEIELFLGKYEADGYVGLTVYQDDNLKPRDFRIDIDKTLSLREFIATICHEMVHVRQFARGELKDLFRPEYRKMWKGADYTGDMDGPWEEEARQLEYKLADQIWKKDIV